MQSTEKLCSAAFASITGGLLPYANSKELKNGEFDLHNGRYDNEDQPLLQNSLELSVEAGGRPKLILKLKPRGCGVAVRTPEACDERLVLPNGSNRRHSLPDVSNLHGQRERATVLRAPPRSPNLPVSAASAAARLPSANAAVAKSVAFVPAVAAAPVVAVTKPVAGAIVPAAVAPAVVAAPPASYIDSPAFKDLDIPLDREALKKLFGRDPLEGRHFEIPGGDPRPVWDSKGVECRYWGGYVNGQPNGVGKWVWPQKEGHMRPASYLGEFVNGEFSGLGIYEYGAGGGHKGRYLNDERNGFGHTTMPNGDVYWGDNVGNQRAGLGWQIKATGEEYVGGWKADLKHSNAEQEYGRLEDPISGMKFYGQWCFDQVHGKGCLKKADGSKSYGEWKYGRKVVV